jgi:two-component system LytT family response regulator
MSVLRVIIADDEPLARNKLERLVESDGRLSLIGVASTGTEAIKLIDSEKPDLVFLDIKMPGATGIQVVERIREIPEIIFTTAFDEYAVTAFELQAIDYLLKPFSRKRFTAAVDRLDKPLGRLQTRVSAALSTDPIEQIFIRERGRMIVVSVESIVRIEAADDYAEVFTESSRHLVRLRMKHLAQRLDQRRFVRIHRSSIVNMTVVEEIASCGNGRYEVVLSDGSTCIASRSGASRLRDIIARSH